MRAAMKTKSIPIAILVAFIAIWSTDFLIHGVWLAPDYQATAHLWRPRVEMMARLPWVLLGQFLVAAAFTLTFAAGVAEKRSLSCTLKFSACVGLFLGGGQVITYAVSPQPGLLVAKWFCAGLVQMIVLGLVVHRVYLPKGQ